MRGGIVTQQELLHSRYNGVRYQREDGSIFGLRLSRDYGLTLDVLESNNSAVRDGFRIHQR